MKREWSVYKEWFEQMLLRERVLVIGAALAVMYLLWSMLVAGPVNKQLAELKSRSTAASHALTTVKAELTVLQGLTNKDPYLQLKQERQALQSHLTQLDNQLSDLSHGLVTAEQLPMVLQQMLEQAEHLHLLESFTLPVKELQLIEKAPANVAEGDEKFTPVKVFRHGVLVKVEGDFQAIFNYLSMLEQNPWQFYWESLDYQVTRYPKAEVWVNVYTLSADKGLFNG